MQLTDHFSLEELTVSDFAERHQIDNSPSADIIVNLHALAEGLVFITSCRTRRDRLPAQCSGVHSTVKKES